MMSKDESAKRISQAAEELVKAVYKQTEDISTDIQREVADNISDIKIESIALKSDMNNKLNTENQNLQDNQKTMESLMTAITTLNTTLMTAITTLNTTMKEEGWKNRIVNEIGRTRDRARDRNNANVRVVGWCFDESGIDFSSGIIMSILIMFLKGKGHFIDAYYGTDMRYTSDDAVKEKSKEAFRKQLKGEIMNITGTIPTIKLTNDRWAIFAGL
jgi:gas vesicle protein